MNEIVNAQTLLFIRAIQIGVILGMLYDLLRIFRKIIKHPNVFIQVEDLVYWGVCIATSFGILYMHNFANIRFFVFIGMILGGILYFCTFSILFMRIATWVIDLLRRIILYVIHLVMIPVIWIIDLLKIPLAFCQLQLVHFNQYRYKQFKKAGRRWYFVKSDMKTGFKVRKQSALYKREKDKGKDTQ